jgi:uncharacterized membrane protein YbhN (UPF0104 family)
MKKHLRKSASFVVRWGIAVVGIWWVISNMSIADHALILGPDNRPVQVEVLKQMASGECLVQTNEGPKTVGEHDIINAPDRKIVKVKGKDGQVREESLLGMDLSGTSARPDVARLLIADSADGPARWIAPSEVAGGFQLKVPNPRIQTGLRRMAADANPWLLVLAVAIFPVTIIMTSIRWKRLLEALEIHLTIMTTTALNMVGLFYNTFIPMGSTGGDLLKAYYAAKHTTHKTRAVLCVIIDRIIGLVVLIMLGGSMAAVYWFIAPDRSDPAVRACLQVAAMSGLILGGMAVGLVLMVLPQFRTLIQSEKIMSRLPMRGHIQSVIEVASIYRRRPGLMVWACLMTIPVHVTVVISAMLCGKAFGLPLTSSYYFVVVPVTVLVGALPISPQGAGVMEFFAISLTSRQGATVSQAFALTMSLRVVQILWNLTGGIFVMTGHYHPPRQDEMADLDEAAPPATAD